MIDTENSVNSSFRYLLVLYIALFVIVIPLLFLAIPNVKRNMEENQVIEHYQLWKEHRAKSISSSKDVYLWSFNGLISTERIMPKGVKDDLHLTIESLLLPLSEEEKQAGFVTFIPEDTKLEGITIKDKKAFIVLSKEFLNTPDLERALESIKMTLASSYEIESLEILVGEEVFSM